MSKPPIYEHWGTPTGREGIQRTLVEDDAQDMAFLAEGITVSDERGEHRRLTLEEANAMGIRRNVAAKDIRTGEMKPDRAGGSPIFVIKV